MAANKCFLTHLPNNIYEKIAQYLPDKDLYVLIIMFGRDNSAMMLEYLRILFKRIRQFSINLCNMIITKPKNTAQLYPWWYDMKDLQILKLVKSSYRNSHELFNQYANVKQCIEIRGAFQKSLPRLCNSSSN